MDELIPFIDQFEQLKSEELACLQSLKEVQNRISQHLSKLDVPIGTIVNELNSKISENRKRFRDEDVRQRVVADVTTYINEIEHQIEQLKECGEDQSKLDNITVQLGEESAGELLRKKIYSSVGEMIDYLDILIQDASNERKLISNLKFDVRSPPGGFHGKELFRCHCEISRYSRSEYLYDHSEKCQSWIINFFYQKLDRDLGEEFMKKYKFVQYLLERKDIAHFYRLKEIY